MMISLLNVHFELLYVYKFIYINLLFSFPGKKPKTSEKPSRFVCFFDIIEHTDINNEKLSIFDYIITYKL